MLNGSLAFVRNLKSFYEKKKKLIFLTTFNIKVISKFFFFFKWLINKYPNKTLHKVWNFSSISIIQLPFIYFYGDQFVKNFHTRKWKRNMERGNLHNFLIPSVLFTTIYLCCFIFDLLLTCDLTYKNHHTPILTYNNNKNKVENQIITLRFKLKNKKPKGKEKIFNFLMGMSLIVQKWLHQCIQGKERKKF